MRTRIKALTFCAAVLATAVVADARNQFGQEKPNREPAGFNCPVCDSPCISKAELRQKLQQRNTQNRGGQAYQQDIRSRPSNARRHGNRQNISQQQRPQKPERFDIDGDGELSRPEKAARRAYRNAMGWDQDARPNERPGPQPQVE